MISAVLLVEYSGDIIAMRKYREDFDMSAVENYRLEVIGRRDDIRLAKVIDKTCFLQHYYHDVYYVAVVRRNTSAYAVFEFLRKLPDLLKQVLELPDVGPAKLREKIPDIFELLDEMVDSGYIQNTDPDTLKHLTQKVAVPQASPDQVHQVTIMATGAISWRPFGISYLKNRALVDLIEYMSLQISASGTALSAFIEGKVTMKTELSGMPECQLGFNDRLSIDKETVSFPHLDIDDVVFHQCVKISKFGGQEAVTFTPPDGEFELMRYKKTNNVKIPFMIKPLVQELRPNKTEIRISVRADYDESMWAYFLSLSVPMPTNAADIEVHSTFGKGKYLPESNSVVWKGERILGQTRTDIVIVVRCLESLPKNGLTPEAGDMIDVDFYMGNYVVSGLSLRYLRVSEKSNYDMDERKVKSVSRAGKYQVKLI
jgi:AP-2 complex subunit mu-1